MPMSALENKIIAKRIFDEINFLQELNAILLFTSEICEVSYGFISSVDEIGQTVKAKVSLDFQSMPDNVMVLNELVIQQQKKQVISDIKADLRYPSDQTDSLTNSFSFYAGFPICTDENLVVGILSVMDHKRKELSPVQLKSLELAVWQIESLLKLHIKNKELEDAVKQRENQFQLFIDNSNEIFYEVALDGIITFASDSWTRFLGYDLSDVIGKSNAEFIHPEDLEKCVTFLEKLTSGEHNGEEMIYRISHQDGYYVWHASCVKLMERDGKQYYTGNCRDITDYVKGQQKLLLQKEFYEKILDQIPTDVAVFDPNYKYSYLNTAAIRNDELRKFILGKDDFEYAKHLGRDNRFARERRAKFIQAVESRQVVEWEDAIQLQNGETIYHTRKLAPVFYEDGSLEMLIGFGVNITESKKIQEEILKSKQLTNSIIQNVAVGILVQGPQSEILKNNKAACDMLGLTEDQLLGKTSFDKHWKVIHLDGTEFLSEEHPVPQAIQKLEPVNNIVMGVHRPICNDLVWLLVDAIPLFGDSGELLYVICSFNDITAQKNAEDSLKVSNERFTYSSEATSDALWDWNMITDEFFVGEGYTALFGHRFENNTITAKECESFIYSEDKESYFESRNKCINSDIYRWSVEYRYLKSDGTYANVNDKAVIIRNDKGEAVRMIGAMHDITKEKKLKDELEQSEAQFKGAFEHSAAGMAIVNLDGYWIEVNNRLCEILGYSKEEFKTMTFAEITYWEDLEEDLANKEKLVSGEASNFNMEKRYIHKNKSLVWVHLSVSVVRNNLGEVQHYIPQIIDITERKKIEEQNKLLTDEINRNKTIQLNEAKNMYRLLADNTVDLVCLHNLDTSFSYVSPSIHKLLGYTPEELLGKFPEEFVHPEDLGTLRKSIEVFVNENEGLAVPIRFRNKEGNYLWLESKANLVIENGIPLSFQSSTRDITQRKEAEEIIENTLIQERELNELRTNLVSTISHEFRTPMTTIRTSAELISMYLEGHNFENSTAIEKRVHTITEEIDRIIELMNAVLTISKEDSGKTNFNPVVFDLKQVCIDVIDASYDILNDRKRVQTSFNGDAFSVFADKSLMEYSLFNLLNNAFKYSEGFGDIMLNVFNTEDTIVIEIIDFGIGIPEQDQSKLFNTFYRASNTDGFQGTGLGLYIVKTFVEKNSGTVALESQIGKGTKVTLKFPLQN